MPHDTVLDEVRRARIAYAERFDFDLKAISLDLKEQEKKNGRKLVSLPPKRMAPVGSPGKADPA